MEEFNPKEIWRKGHIQDIIQREISNMPDPEYKATTKILAELEENIEDTRESLNTKIKEQNTNQAKIKNAIDKIRK